MAKQDFGGTYTMLGEVLYRRGNVTRSQLKRALRVQGTRRIGDVVVILGYCTQEEVSAAAEEQEQLRFIPNGVDSKSEQAFERAMLALESIDNCLGDEPDCDVDPGQVEIIKL